MKKLFLILFVSSIAFITSAQQPVSSEKEALITEYLKLTGGLDAVPEILDRLFEQFEKMLPNVPEKFWKETQKGFKEDELVEILIPIYDKHFTEQDLKDMIAFYNTPTGKKLSQSVAAISKESMAAGEEYGRSLAERVIEKLKAKGYKLE